MSPYKIYINWRVKLLDSTDPKTLEEFLVKYNLTNKEILEFQATATYEDDLRKASLSWLQSKIPQLLHVAYKEAMESGNVADIERLVDIAHALKKKGETQNNQFNFFNLNEQQHKRIAERYLQRGTASISAGSSQN